jgi:hypothetical protein
MGPEQAARTFIAAWNVDDDGERRRLLESCCAGDARFVSPHGLIAGLDEFSRSVGAFRRAFPHASVVLGEPRAHFGYASFRWETRWNDGRPALYGDDFLGFDADGRISLVVSFDGTAALPSESRDRAGPADGSRS